MFRVLTSLALSMVGGAGLLFWLEPDLDPDLESDMGSSIALTSTQRAVRFAERAVAACPALNQRWDAVTIVPIDSREESRSLAAVPQRNDLHFVVSSDGSIQAEGLWLVQGTAGRDGAMIRVGMHVRSDDQQIGTDQFEGLRALWTTLNDRIAHVEGTIPLTLKFADAGRYARLRDSIASSLLDSNLEG